MRRAFPLAVVAALLAVVAWWALRSRPDHVETGALEPTPPPPAAGEAAPGREAPAPLLRADPRAEHGTVTRAEPSLHGRVLNAATREPIAGAAVVAYGYEDLWRLSTATDDDGTFRLPGTAGRAGAFHLAVTASGHGRFTDDAARASVEPRTVLLEAEGAVEGRLVEAADDSAVRRFRVVALRRPGRFTDARSVRNALPEDQDVGATLDVDDLQGRFRIGGLPAGTYALVFLVEDRGPFFWSGGKASYEEGGFAVAAGVTADAGTARLPRPGTVVVRVLDAATERPLAGATFEGALLVDEREVTLPLRPSEVRGGSDYVLALPFDEKQRLLEMEVVVRVAGYAPAVTGGYGQAPGETFVVRLAAPATLAGTVRTGTGDDSGCLVLVRRDVDRGVLASVTTDARGAFSIPGLPPGIDLEVLVFERAADRLRFVAALRLDPAETRTLRLGALDATGVEGRVTLGGKPVLGAWVFLDAAGRRTHCPTDEDGRFRFEEVPVGRHELFVNLALAEDTGDAYLGGTVGVEAGHVTRILVDLSAEVRGRLTSHRLDGSAAEVAGKSLVARPATPAGGGADWVPETRTRTDGSFTLRLPGPGPWLLDLDEEDLYLADGPVTVDLARARDASEAVTLAATVDPQDGRIEIDVRDAETGQGIPDAGYEYRWRHTAGAGTAEGARPVTLEKAGLGSYRFVIEAPAHVSTPIDVELTLRQRSVRTTASLPRSDAVRVIGLDALAQAQSAGLRVGDVLVRYGDRPTRDMGELGEAVKATSPTDLVNLDILRDGAPQTLRVHGGRLGIEVENVRAPR